MEPSSSDIWKRLKRAGSKFTLRLITKGRKTGLPRPVRVWFICLDSRLFLRTTRETQWYKNVRVHPQVQAEVDSLKFSAQAELVEDEATIRMVQSAYRRKYHIFDFLRSLRRWKGEVFLELKATAG
ncbi:nitroreductase/quinone reductase family protein [Candidatus Hecatella orcuttiae]|uniref:nitroreductase/quinone reductase family protein n=1 Tax=Candidatus Hecatella orcuttiae TaxID=1935119 RepID=UPI0028683775|nr:nitroreductase/quinone reductase family protein [Candidatus Hecatella orcuttiae]